MGSDATKMEQHVVRIAAEPIGTQAIGPVTGPVAGSMAAQFAALHLQRGRFVVRFARNVEDVVTAQALRHRAFFPDRDPGLDTDAFDGTARHVMVWDMTEGALVACFRAQMYQGVEVAQSYAAQFYDLTALAAFPGILMEMGRFCLNPQYHDPDILRLAWAAMTHMVDQAGVSLLFGCSSFPGADPQRHAAALGQLMRRVAPSEWRPGARAAETVSLADFVGTGSAAEALAGTPALLRTYLGMGGWVSDHAVIDRQMDTVHVLTGVEVAKIPPARVRALRQIVADCLG